MQFMCSLQKLGRGIHYMVVIRVHGGTSSKTIHKKVRQAIELAHINEERHKVDTILFLMKPTHQKLLLQSERYCVIALELQG